MGNDGEYLRRLGEGEIHGENLRFCWFWVGGLRGRERAAATQLEVREEVREEASSGLGRLTLIQNCGATLHGAAEATATPPTVAPHLPGRGPLSLRGSQCRATGSGAAPRSAAPPWTARQKRVSPVNFFCQRFIFYICFKFGLFLSKSPRYSAGGARLAPWSGDGYEK
jgi:hypothetical protein